MEERFCYYCDEKWNPTHRCKKTRIYLLQGLEDTIDQLEYKNKEGSEGEILEEVAASEEKGASEISLATLAGTPTMSTVGIMGSIMGVQIVILVELGSSHNFIDAALFFKLQLKVDHSSKLSMKVANGQCLQSLGVCEGVKLKVQGNSFHTSFYLLDLAGCDIVLGVQWLLTLGPISWDFSKLMMSFIYVEKYMVLRGIKLKTSTMEDASKFVKSTNHNGNEILLPIVASKPAN